MEDHALDNASPLDSVTNGAEVQSWKSFLLSFLLHGLLVIILCVSFRATQRAQVEPDRPVGIVLTASNPDDPKDYFDETEPLLADAMAVEPAVSDAVSDIAPPMVTPTSSAPAIDVQALPGNLDVNSMTQVADRASVARQLTQAELDQIAADQARFAANQPKGPPASVSVFGSESMSGQSFLFLLDRSASMGAGGLGVIQASRSELSKAIGGLEGYHRFQVVGYNDKTVPMNQRQLLNADPQNKIDVSNFISKMAAFGPTNHVNALLSSLAMKPDVIVLMTDGGLPELNAGQLKRIHNSAKKKTQIHCIQFGRGPNQQTLNFMRLLAEQNNGSYQYIDVNQWEESP